MKYAYGIAALAAVVSASPILTKKAITDIDILNYALTLEHLEDTFYRQGLANYTEAQFVAAGFAAPFYSNLKEVASDEKTHVAFLAKALGTAAVAECIYSFPSTDVASFVALAGVLEGVGVSAYLGAAASIVNKDYLTAAGSILTIEARHSSYLRASQKQVPFPAPFDAPLTFDEVYTLAAPFIVSCPKTNVALPVKAFPSLTLAKAGPVTPGSKITILTPEYALKATGELQLYAAFITVTGPIFADVEECDGGFITTVPEMGISGQSYVVLTACNDKVTDDTVAAGPLILEVDCGCT